MSNSLIDIIIVEPVIRRVMIVENERRQAIEALLEQNSFTPTKEGVNSPFIFVMEMIENGQAIACIIQNKEGENIDAFKISLKPFRRILKDYFQICESYFDAVKRLTNVHLETIDMARRALHNESAELLQRVLENNVIVDFETARRLFTLVSVMHIRG